MKFLKIMKNVRVFHSNTLAFLLISLSIIPDVAFAGSGLWDCGGPDKIFTLKKGSVSPDPVQYPGNISLSVTLELTEDLPSEKVELCVNLVKLKPKMTIPCVDNFGSCCYDLCEELETRKKEFCPLFPADAECCCPIKASTYKIKRALFPLPDFGDNVSPLIKGDYEGNITVTDVQAAKALGCIRMKFGIVPEK